MKTMAALAGLTVAITRPRQYAESLTEQLTALGAKVMLAPTIDLQCLPSLNKASLEQLQQAEQLIFVSQAAVDCLCQQAQALTLLQQHSLQKAVIAIGEATAQALSRHGIQSVFPQGAPCSESLLAQPYLAAPEVKGRSIAIVSGIGGRTLLAETLQARGAKLTLIESYERQQPKTLPAEFLAALHDGKVDIVTISSVTALKNLLNLLNAEQLTTILQDKVECCVSSERILQLAQSQFKIKHITNSNSAESSVIASVLAQRRQVV